MDVKLDEIHAQKTQRGTHIHEDRRRTWHMWDDCTYNTTHNTYDTLRLRTASSSPRLLSYAVSPFHHITPDRKGTARNVPMSDCLYSVLSTAVTAEPKIKTHRPADTSSFV